MAVSVPVPDRLRALRRTLHARPETAFTEVLTAATVVRTLQESLRGPDGDLRWGDAVCDLSQVRGLPSPEALGQARDRAREAGAPADLVEQLGHGSTGVVARVRGSRPGPVTAVRCDLDALPVQESASSDHLPTREGFASRHEGLMHACGHDGHVAVGVELVTRLAADRDFPGEVVVVFQPAEEGVRGAATMTAAVADADRLLGWHLGLGLPVGTVAASAHGVMATEKWAVTLRGAAAHAALAPEQGRHALLAAAAATLALHTLPQVGTGSTRVNVGRLEGGTSPNVVPAWAEIGCEVRADTAAGFDLVRERARAAVAGSADAYGVAATVEVRGRALPVRCDEGLVDLVLRTAGEVAGVDDPRRTAPMSASDDVTVLMDAVQRAGGEATLMLVGGGSPAPHHHELFDVDEQALAIAADWLERTVRHETSA